MTKKLKNLDLVNADADVAQVVSQELDYSVATYFWDLADVLEASVKNVNKLRVDMIKKLGVKNPDGTYNFPNNEDGSPNENFEKFTKQYQEVLDQEKEITFEPIPERLMKGIKFKEGRGSILRKHFIVKPTPTEQTESTEENQNQK